MRRHPSARIPGLHSAHELLHVDDHRLFWRQIQPLFLCCELGLLLELHEFVRHDVPRRLERSDLVLRTRVHVPDVVNVDFELPSHFLERRDLATHAVDVGAHFELRSQQLHEFFLGLRQAVLHDRRAVRDRDVILVHCIDASYASPELCHLSVETLFDLLEVCELVAHASDLRHVRGVALEQVLHRAFQWRRLLVLLGSFRSVACTVERRFTLTGRKLRVHDALAARSEATASRCRHR